LPRSGRAGEDHDVRHGYEGIEVSVERRPAVEDAQTPIGCQTVLDSRNGVIRESDWAVGVPGRRTRLRLAAASASRARATSAWSTPARSRAPTSRCPASQEPASVMAPVSMLTTPPGTADVDRISDSVIAGSGRAKD